MIKKVFKWIFRILILLIVGILVFGSIKQANYDSEVEDKFKPTGKFSDIGENKIHYNYLDQGDFTFVLISGLGETMHTWSTIEDELNKRGRVFMYDRSGLGFSEEGILPRSVDNSALELNVVLEKEEIPGPYILIGHSAGAFIARYYAKKYPQEVLGLYLIDQYQGDVAKGELPERSLKYKLTNWSFRRMSWSGVPFYLLPNNPPHPIYKTSKGIKTYAWEGHSEEISLEQFEKIDHLGNDLPLYVLQADKINNKYNNQQKKWSKRIFNKYTNVINQYIIIESGHHIHIEKPEAVLNSLDNFVSKLVEK